MEMTKSAGVGLILFAATTFLIAQTGKNRQETADKYSDGRREATLRMEVKDLEGPWTPDPQPIVPIEEQIENSKKRI